MSELPETLAGEWDSYYREVLVKHGVPPETARALRQVFYGGATAMFALIARCSTPYALRAEIEEHAASLLPERRQ
jgi:hypothetical protein